MASAGLSRTDLVYHEAGHAIMAIELSYSVKRVTIVPNEDAWGHTQIRWPHWLFDEVHRYDELTAHRERVVYHYIMVNLAGAAAVRIHKGRGTWALAHTDLRNAADAAEGYLGGSDEQRQALYRWLWLRTRDMLQHQWTWPRVEALAAALLRQETLTGKEVRATIARANQETLARYGIRPLTNEHSNGPGQQAQENTHAGRAGRETHEAGGV